MKQKFIIAECIQCKNILWPPTKFCNNCFSNTTYREGKKHGKIIEYSKKNNQYFCIAEFEGKIKLFGKIIEGTPRKNDWVNLKEIHMENNSYFFKMSVSQK